MIPGSERVNEYGTDVTYSLPLTEVEKFSDLFEQLEARPEALNVKSFGVTLTTLEEVFLKLAGEEKDKEENAHHETEGKGITCLGVTDCVLLQSSRKNTICETP